MARSRRSFQLLSGNNPIVFLLVSIFTAIFWHSSATPVAAVTGWPDSLHAQLTDQVWQSLLVDFTNTGDNTAVAAEQAASTTESTESKQNATVNQAVTATANTGYNEASRNISIGGNAGVITTGQAAVQVIAGVGANQAASANDPSVEGTTPMTEHADGLAVVGSNTGDYVTVDAAATDTRTTLVNGLNQAVIAQTTDARASTGGNVADRNISIGGSAGVITTGQASVGVGYLIAANNTVALVGGESDDGGPGSGASIVRSNTGDNSAFSTTQQFNQAFAVQTHNTAVLGQSANVLVNTGDNTSNRGVAFGGNAGVISTAPAVVVLQMLATANPTQHAVAPAQTVGPASLSSTTTNTGDDAAFDDQTSTTTTQLMDTTNLATVSQSVAAQANTGRNTANRNISIGGDAGVITTGNALVDIALFVVANPTVTDMNLP